MRVHACVDERRVRDNDISYKERDIERGKKRESEHMSKLCNKCVGFESASGYLCLRCLSLEVCN